MVIKKAELPLSGTFGGAGLAKAVFASKVIATAPTSPRLMFDGFIDFFVALA